MHSDQQQPKPVITPDPNLAAEQAKAQKALIDGLQTQAQMDTADLMARYGTKLALGGAGMSPMAAPATSPIPSSVGVA